MQVIRTRRDIRNWRSEVSGSVGLVPTMGALHAGHMSLVDVAGQENDHICVSIFVNPRQFGSKSDFATYPRTTDEDLSMLQDAGVDAVFMPDAGEMYAGSARTSIHVADLTDRLEGASRPGHFDGVCLVVSKLFNLVQPDHAYFGWKDAQQVRVIQQMVDDLDMPVQIRPMPTVRDDDGLALSSRNCGLTISGRESARHIPAALGLVEQAVRNGEFSVDLIRRRAIEHLSGAEDLEVDYVQIVDLESLQPLDRIDRPALVLIAAICDDIRLIDNLLVSSV